MRFRDEELNFKISDTFEEKKMDKAGAYKYPEVFIIKFSCLRSKVISN